tara:strand:- start:7785 stop:8621 length:837 start_codon:yes stop_codon:yes gene_type:complete
MNRYNLNLIREKYFLKRKKILKRNKKNNKIEYQKKFLEAEKFFSLKKFIINDISLYFKNYNRNGYFLNNSNFKKLKNVDYFKSNVHEIKKILKKYSDKHTNIYELGSGFGRIIFSLILFKFKDFKKFYACDFNEVGLRIINKISKKNNYKIKTHKIDLLKVEDLNNLKSKSVIFTVNALMCVPNLKISFFKEIIKKKPKAVIHFEATYINKPKNVLEKMSKKYFNNCDYNKTFLSHLEKLNKEDKIDLKILNRKFLSNILLNEKIIIWKPKYKLYANK